MPTRDTRAIASKAVITKYLGIGVNRIKALIKCYFRRLTNGQLNEELFDSQLEQCFEQDYLVKAATLTLKERAAKATMLRNRIISVDQLRAEYKRRGIKKKRVIKKSANTSKYTPDVLRQLIFKLKEELDLAIKYDYELFLIDESFFFG